MQFFKSCLSIIWGLLFGLYAYSSFQEQYANATKFANTTTSEAATVILGKEEARLRRETKDFDEKMGKHLQEPVNNPAPTPPKPMRWQSVDDPELLKAAEVAISRSKEALQMSSFSIQFRKIELGALGFFYGTLSYGFWCFIVVITTKPLDSAFDSTLGNFSRFVVTPFIFTAVSGGILWALFGPLFGEMILPSPLGQLGLCL